MSSLIKMMRQFCIRQAISKSAESYNVKAARTVNDTRSRRRR